MVDGGGTQRLRIARISRLAVRNWQSFGRLLPVIDPKESNKGGYCFQSQTDVFKGRKKLGKSLTAPLNPTGRPLSWCSWACRQ